MFAIKVTKACRHRKEEGKDQELIQSSTTPDPGHHMSHAVHEISNNVVCATSKASDRPAHMRSLIRAFASRLSIL